MIMIGAARVKFGVASGTAITAFEILVYRQLISADAAKDSSRIKIISMPNLRFVIFDFVVTLAAGKPATTTPELYCDDIRRAIVMDAPRLIIDNVAADL